eukprot:CAMPEP_0204287572 /NCGR_PEP_ID=MMETSP0468-20130131/55042_1 /ASSEMBLY_ACC=CAM_ASM_000383 /TAXON_ID=2969 /ORGANISM="Oxyrrhis marina" /LENGTH=45 /DNA_ID= /DNA_START= /DNA_END= /DNA_ORIENTATION=
MAWRDHNHQPPTELCPTSASRHWPPCHSTHVAFFCADASLTSTSV